MMKILRQLSLLIFASILLFPSASSQLVEEFRSPTNRKLASSFIQSKYNIKDLNNNGTLDVASRYSDSLYNCGFWVIDGETKEVIYDSAVEADDNIHTHIAFIDLGIFLDPGECRIYRMTKGPNGYMSLVYIESDEIEWSETQVGKYRVMDIDKGGAAELVYEDKSTNQVVVLGLNDAEVKQEDDIPFEIRNASVEYELELKYESEINNDLLFNINTLDIEKREDLNGDGFMELIIAVTNDDGEFAGIVVRSGKDHEIVWSFQFPEEHTEDLRKEFHGFYDCNGDGEVEAIFGHRTVVTLDKEVHQLDENFEIRAIYDLNDDGYEEVLGLGQQDSTVQVWGRIVSTGVSDNDYSNYDSFFNYPNPFVHSTTISYELTDKSDVEIIITDAMGKEIDAFSFNNKPAGVHHIEWDCYDTGQFYYQLIVDGKSQTKTMLSIK